MQEIKSTLKVVKIGGKLIENEQMLSEFITDFVNLKGPKILIHGGGNLATEIASKLGYETKMFEGRRITDENSMKVITMVYGGLLNKQIVAKLQEKKCNAIGLCGADGMSIVSEKRPVKEIDFGFVGDIVEINEGFISGLLKQGLVPVFSAISCSKSGELFNTNADSVASEIATAMRNYDTELFYCFEKKGVLENINSEDSVIRELDHKKYQDLKEKGIIRDGMLPKLHNCFEALKKGVKNIYLGDSSLLKSGDVSTKITV